MKTRVLMIGSSLKDKGGIVTVMRNILEQFDESDVEIDIVPTYITGSLMKRLRVFCLGFISYVYKIFRNRPDVIHIHMAHGGSFYRKSLLILVAKTLKISVITHIHGSSFKEFYLNLNNINKNYCKRILNMSDTLLVLSKEWKDFFSKIADETKIYVLYNGVKVQEGLEYKRHNQMVTCLFLGRMNNRKGIFDLLNVAKNLNKNEVICKFILAGDGEIDKVCKFVKTNNMEHYIEVMGWIDNDEKQKILSMSDVLVLPSYNEGLPMAILEAMSYGLSIVSTPVGGIPEAVCEGENGYLLNPGDIWGMEQKIRSIIENQKMRSEMFDHNTTKIYNKFNKDQIFKELLNIYKSYMIKSDGGDQYEKNMSC